MNIPDSLLQLIALLLPWGVIIFVWFKYYRTYRQLRDVTGSKLFDDPQSLWNGLRGATTAILEMVVVITISEFVFLLAFNRILQGETAATFFGGLIGYLIGSTRQRAPDPIPGDMPRVNKE